MSHLMRNALYEIMHGGSTIATELMEIKRQLSAIGNNLNQIAKHANSTGEIGTIDNIDRNLSDMREELRKTLKKVWR
ncbi:MobC family plasmid mobilization relaxosome protein [Acetobacter sp. DmW_136]|nr:MobC family plasmid mobilization relaxosome protein [Acetobacter sp. DmW_136]